MLRLLIFCLHLGLEAAETIGFPVNELRILGKSRMDFFNLAPHLLHDEAIVRMALGHGAQLADEHRLAQIHLHVPADLISERDDILGLEGKIAVYFLIDLGSLFHAAMEIRPEAGLFDFRRSIIAVRSGEVLSLLGEDPMAVKIAVKPKIAENIEGIVNLLEGASGLVPSTTSPLQIFI